MAHTKDQMKPKKPAHRHGTWEAKCLTILALGLSTGIIAMVINIVAFLFKDMIPFIGWPVAIVILLGGHLFNLAINALGSFIHSGRLQYVEFFPKFMEGGGTRFKPLVKTAKYVDIYDES